MKRTIRRKFRKIQKYSKKNTKKHIRNTKKRVRNTKKHLKNKRRNTKKHTRSRRGRGPIFPYTWKNNKKNICTKFAPKNRCDTLTEEYNNGKCGDFAEKKNDKWYRCRHNNTIRKCNIKSTSDEEQSCPVNNNNFKYLNTEYEKDNERILANDKQSAEKKEKEAKEKEQAEIEYSKKLREQYLADRKQRNVLSHASEKDNLVHDAASKSQSKQSRRQQITAVSPRLTQKQDAKDYENSVKEREAATEKSIKESLERMPKSLDANSDPFGEY